MLFTVGIIIDYVLVTVSPFILLPLGTWQSLPTKQSFSLHMFSITARSQIIEFWIVQLQKQRTPPKKINKRVYKQLRKAMKRKTEKK